MEDRSLRLDFEKGKIKGVWLKASLDDTYKRLFEDAYKLAEKYPKDVEHGIKIIIFGCFWLESYSNELLMMILKYEIKFINLRKEVWNRLKRDSIHSKFDLFSQLVSSMLRQEHLDFKNNIKETFDFRAQLAHYKNEPQKIAGEISFKQVSQKILNRLPVPELNQKLMWNKVRAHAETIRDGGKWLNKVSKYCAKRYGLKQTNKAFHPNISQSRGTRRATEGHTT